MTCTRHHNWVFTWFTDPVEESFFEDWITCSNGRYIVVGAEHAPSTGKFHYQGYVEWNTARSLKGLKRIHRTISWKVARGNAAQNRVYCSKEQLFCEFGIPSNQGKRNDISDIRNLLIAGGSMADVVQQARSYQAAKFGELFSKYVSAKRNWQPEVLWLWGPTGSGKSRTAFELAPDAWVSANNLTWWDGYCGQADVILDDFRGDFCKFHELLRLLDRYPCRVQLKGSSTEFLARRIIITSCYPPDRVYHTREDIGQLLRRITRVIQFPLSGDLNYSRCENTVSQPISSVASDAVPARKSGGNTVPLTSYPTTASAADNIAISDDDIQSILDELTGV